MLLKNFFPALFVLAFFKVSSAPALRDTTERASTSLLIRLTSSGIFPYSGYITNLHPNMDISIVHSEKSWSVFFEKSFDLLSNTTGLNYASAGFYRDVAVTRKLTFTPSVCYAFTTPPNPAVSEAEVDIIAAFTYKINNTLSLENITVFSNTVNNCPQTTAVNRLKMMCKTKLFDLNFFTWTNAPIWGNTAKLSVSPEIVFKKISVTKHTDMTAAFSYYKTLVTGEIGAIKNSFIVSISMPVNF